MPTELEFLAEKLRTATTPFEIFGSDPEQARRTYRKIAMLVHPDKHLGDGQIDLAKRAFVNLERWWKIQQGASDPKPNGIVEIKTRKRTYKVGETFSQGDLATLYLCEFEVDGKRQEAILKVARNPRDNDLVKSEAAALKALSSDKDAAKMQAFTPSLAESFVLRDSGFDRQANVLTLHPEIVSPKDLYSLEDVRRAYPGGVHPADMAWMFRRLLAVLSFAHQAKLIHAAVLPPHILIHPALHGLVLIDWSYAVTDPTETGQRVVATPANYTTWYPKEVTRKSPPLPGLDLYLAAESMIYLLGGDPAKGTSPDAVPSPLRAFFRGCLIEAPAKRPQDPGELLVEFDDLLIRLYGPRKFRPFTMPKK